MGFAGNQSRLREFASGHLPCPSRPLVAGRHHDHQFVLPHHTAAQSLGRTGVFHEPEIDGAVADRRDGVLTVGGGQHHLGGGAAPPRRFGLQGQQPVRHELFGNRLAGRHLDPLAALLAQRAHPRIDLVGHVEQPGRPVRDDQARRRQLRAACRPDGQSDPDLGLHRREPPRNGLLGQPEFAGGAAEAARLGDRQKHLERGEFGHPRAERHG